MSHCVFLKVIIETEVVLSEHLVHQRSNPMDIFIADLHEDRARLGEQVARDGKAVAQVGQVAVNAVAPSVAEALTCSGSRVMWSALPSFTSRLVVDHWKLLLNLMP